MAIAEINADSKSVPTSHIKRLIEISFQGISVGTSGTTVNTRYTSATPSRFTSTTLNLGAARRVGGSELFLPEYVHQPNVTAPGSITSGSKVENVGQIAASWTQRVSGELVDVVQFEMGVIINTIKIGDFINALQSEKFTKMNLTDSTHSNQFRRNQITVLQIMIEPIEADLEKESGFYYGPGSLAVLRLVGEYVFFKSGYGASMPKIVKEILNPPVQPAGTSASFF